MLNYTDLLYSNIANRIKAYRNAIANKTQLKFCTHTLCGEIDVSTLSRIENVKIDKNRNPYLLSKGNIKTFCKYIKTPKKVTPTELIWGTEQERENFIKIILLSLIMNGDKLVEEEINPFFYSEDYSDLFHWAYKQRICQDDAFKEYISTACAVIDENIPYNDNTTVSLVDENIPYNDNITPSLIEPHDSITFKDLLNKTLAYFNKEYKFFFNQDNFYAYEKLKNGYDKRYEEISNLLLKRVLREPIFAQSFYHRLVNKLSYGKEKNEEGFKKNLDDFILGKGTYGLLALDCVIEDLPNDYYRFVNAFNIFWEQNKKELMKFFNKHIFENKNLEQSGLKTFDNKFFRKLLTSDEFVKLNRKVDELNKHHDRNSILSNYFFESAIQEALARNDMEKQACDTDTKGKIDISLFEFVSDISALTNNYINKNIK